MAYLHSLLPDRGTRIDLFNATKELCERKTAVETVAAAFTDHHAVMLRLTVHIPILRRGRGMWKVNTALVDDAECKAKLCHQWEHWTRQYGTFRSQPCGGADSSKRKSDNSTYRKESNGGETLGKWNTSIMHVSTKSCKITAHTKRN